ncbi:MAG: AAA family ATPase [Bacillota bacterium]
MTERIRVLLVDDSYQVRQSVKAMLEFEAEEFDVVGEAQDGHEAVTKAVQLRPDVVLMDINMPGMDGIEATAKLMAEHPVNVVIISVQGEQEYLRRAMKAGARDYLIKPFTFDELIQAIRSAAEKRPLVTGPVSRAAGPAKREGKVITIFSTKGGVGKTTIAANLSAALAQGGTKKVAVIDLDLEFGTLPTMMGVRPQATLVDLCRLDTPITVDHVNRVLARQSQSNVGVLAGPPMPHLASEVDGDGRADKSRNYVTEVLEALRQTHDYVVIDTAPSFREANLIALDKSDLVLMITLPEIAVLESTAKGLDVLLERLEYPREKVQVILNRSDSVQGLSHGEIAASLGQPLYHHIPSDGQAMVAAANVGIPLVLKRSRNGPAGEALIELAGLVSGEQKTPSGPKESPPEKAQAPGGLRKLFGLA